jgi:hypothetical protein
LVPTAEGSVNVTEVLGHGVSVDASVLPALTATFTIADTGVLDTELEHSPDTTQ